MKKIFYVIIVSFDLLACTNLYKGKLESQIEQYIDRHYITDTSHIDISKITKFEWDTLYVFSERASLDEVEQAIGMQYSYFRDIGKRFIFIKQGKIIYHEDIYPYPDQIDDGQIAFDIIDTLKYKIYTNSLFNVTRRHSSSGYFYFLSQ
jgi:hypothetical protein